MSAFSPEQELQLRLEAQRVVLRDVAALIRELAEATGVAPGSSAEILVRRLSAAVTPTTRENNMPNVIPGPTVAPPVPSTPVRQNALPGPPVAPPPPTAQQAVQNALPGLSAPPAAEVPVRLNALPGEGSPVVVASAVLPAVAPVLGAPPPQPVVAPPPPVQPAPAAAPPPVALGPKPAAYMVPGTSATRSYAYRPPIAMHPLVAGTSRSTASPATVLPPSVDLRGIFMPVSDQGRDDVSAGYATAALRESLYALANDKLLPGRLDPHYIADTSHMVSGVSGYYGMSVADELLVLVQYGVPPVNFPQQARDVAALPFRLADVPVQVDMTEASVKAVLADKRPVVVAFIAHASSETPDEGGKLIMFDPEEPVFGGHVGLIVGYDETGWTFRNSFGEGWGVGGHATMPYGYERCWLEAWSVAPRAG